MSLLDKLFSKKQPVYRPKMPTWDEIIEHMQGQELSFFADTIVQVFLSKDRSKRILILRSDHGYYKTVYEEIRVWDEDEWSYFCNDPDRYPAWWEPVDSAINGKSFYGTADEARKAVIASYEYKAHFV